MANIIQIDAPDTWMEKQHIAVLVQYGQENQKWVDFFFSEHLDDVLHLHSVNYDWKHSSQHTFKLVWDSDTVWTSKSLPSMTRDTFLTFVLACKTLTITEIETSD